MRLLRIPLLTALAAWSCAAAAQDTLGMAQVKALITGRTVDVHRLSDGASFRNYYAASGDVILQRADAQEFTGRWSLRADGTLCVFFDTEICGSTRKNADGTYTRVVNGAPAFRWLKVTRGKDF